MRRAEVRLAHTVAACSGNAQAHIVSGSIAVSERSGDADENKEPRRCREGVVSEQRLHNKLPSPQAVGTSAVARGGFLNKKRDPGDRARKLSSPPLKLLVSAKRTHDASRACRSRRRLPQHCGRTASPKCPHCP